MSASPSDAASLVERLKRRIAQLEQTLLAHRIPVPEDPEGGGSAMETLGFPELDFSEPKRKPARKVQVQGALEAFPHIATTLTTLWGRDGFDEYLAKLIVDDRGTRRGFSMDAMEELLMLARLARGRKALFGMELDPKGKDVWKEIPETSRRAAGPAVR